MRLRTGLNLGKKKGVFVSGHKALFGTKSGCYLGARVVPIPSENAVTPRLVEPLCCSLGQNTLEKVAAKTSCYPLPKGRGAPCKQDGRGPLAPARRLPRPGSVIRLNDNNKTEQQQNNIKP